MLLVILAAATAMTPIHLTCERLVDPLPIDNPRPGLSWALEAEGRNRSQTGYRILVAESLTKLSQSQGDLWDSGEVKSDNPLDIAYAGKPLTSAETAFWKVQVWDERGSPGPWSKPAHWTQGLKPEDWHATWIARSESVDPQPAPMFRKEFDIDGRVQSAILFASALGYGEFRLNGESVANTERDPGYTRFDKRVLYTAYDVTKSLKQGRNAIGATLGTGWFDVHTVAVWHFDKAPWRASPRMIAQLLIRYEDGKTQTVATDETWQTSDGPIVYDSIYGGETYDARLDKPGWDRAEYVAKDWRPAVAVKAPATRMDALEMPPIRATRTMKPIAIIEPKRGTYIVDFGQNMSGHVRLHASGPAGTKITLKYTEKLGKDGMPDRANIEQFIDKKSPGARFQTDETILGDSEPVTRHPSPVTYFTYHGFRYVEVEGFPGQPTKDNFEAVFEHTDVPPRMKFDCSDPMIDKISKAADWSYLSNLQSIPTDCPQREKNGWTGDAQLAADQALFHWDAATVYRKWMNDFDDVQTEAGDLPGIVPTGGWGYGVGPAWDSAYFFIPESVRLFDDLYLSEHHLEGQKRYLDYLIKRFPDGVVDYGLGDWVPFKTETPSACTSTAFAYEDARLLAATFTRMGQSGEGAQYSQLADRFKEAWVAKFYDTKKASVANGSQTALSCGLYFGLVPAADRERVFRNLVRNNEETGHLDFGILGAKWVPNVLAEGGRADLALQLITRREYPSWAWWIEQGATTLWESWKGEDSLNHIMFGDVNAWFVKHLAGLQPDPAAPGFKHFFVKPELIGGLTYASAVYESVRGRTVSSWRLEGDRFDLEVVVPPNTSCTVSLPSSAIASCKESGRALDEAVGISDVRVNGGRVTFQARSGAYRFEAPR